MEGFRELRVWQAAMDFVEQVYRASQTWPAQEAFGLTSQVRRASVSVPSNIAEGHSRDHLKEYLHHLSMARASLAEAETQLEIAGRLGYLPSGTLDETLRQASALGKQLYALRNSLQRRGAGSPPP